MHWRHGITIAAIGAAIAGLLWQVPQWHTAAWRAVLAPTDGWLIENAFRQTLVLIVGAALTLIVLALLWRRVAAVEGAMRESLGATQDAQRRERFAIAVSQLADARPAVRIGALYVLEQIAAESPVQHWPIMEVLCAYVREHAGWLAERPPAEQLPIDVQTVLTVLGRRARGNEHGERLDLRATDLRRAPLAGAHFERALLAGAHLEDASLQEAQLTGTDLRGAFLDRADMAGANLQGADLREAHLESVYLVEAHLERANFGGAFMAGAFLSGAHLEGADLGGAQLEGAYFYRAHLEGASLPTARPIATPAAPVVPPSDTRPPAEELPRAAAPSRLPTGPVSLRTRKRRRV